MLRTHRCGELRKSHVGKKVKLAGWVGSVRPFGKVSFVDLRDRYGKTQVIIKGKTELKQEYCVLVEGKVVKRKDANKNIPTGDIEIIAKDVKILNKSEHMPFELNDKNISEDVRLKYRFLDLRRGEMQKNLILRHKVLKAISEHMDKRGFIHIETPILGKSTPEGARDYIVPSRVNKGKFYALPQSPQIFKQLMMIAGYDKYYQIARCFRDEDLRADRQPEFTQLDIEMSFIEQEDLMKEIEGLYKFVWKEVLGENIKTPFLRMSYDEVMKKYKKDNPDTRRSGEKWGFVWIVDFPMFEWKKEDKRLGAMHHPFTMPASLDFSKAKSMKSKAYDLVLNGVEIGGGSIRIHDLEIQNKVFEVLGIGKKEAEEKFGFLLKALSFGAPPHGGIAFGLDRVVQLMAGAENIREVITFPKNQDAKDLMMNSPSVVDEKQLREVGVRLEKGKKEK